MASSDTDVVTPMLSTRNFRSMEDRNNYNSTSRNIITARTRRSVSMPIRMDQRNTPGRDAFIQMSGPFLRSNSNNEHPTQVHNATADSIHSEPKTEKVVHDERWNKFFACCCVFAVFLDPMFYFLLSVRQDNKCILLNWTPTKVFLVLRSMTDFIFFLQMLLRFRHAYGTMHKFFRYFIIDFFLVLPLPQIIVLVVTLSDSMGVEAAFNLLLLLIAQYVSRTLKFFPLLEQTPLGYLVISLLAYAFLTHAVASSWYINGLQTVHGCFTDACRRSNITQCKKFINCGRGGVGDFKSFELADNSSWALWKNNEDAVACFEPGRFEFGIYQNAVNLTAHENLMTRYLYSLFWGFQQISTLAGNQVPSYSWGQVIFAMIIIGNGLFLYVSLIANMQTFLQARQRRGLEMYLKTRELEKWMGYRGLPEELRSQVRDAELFNWAATGGGMNEEILMENLPEDLQRDIRRHIFRSITNVPILQGLDESIIDAILERLKTKTYIKGSRMLSQSRLIDKMVFIIEGEMESIGEDGVAVPLAEGDVCGEELLTWLLQHYSSVNEADAGNIIRNPGHRRLLSKRSVRCLTNVKASVLRAADLEEVVSLVST